MVIINVGISKVAARTTLFVNNNRLLTAFF